MDIFNYHPLTSEYLSTETAALDPLDQLPLIPGFATDIPPSLPPSDGFVAVFNGTDWVEVEDNRGTIYNTTNKIPLENDALGPLIAPYTTKVPTDNSTWDGADWAFDLTLVQASKKREIVASFNAALTAGFETSVSNIVMDADISDILKFDAGIRLAESLNQPSITIRDHDNVTHSVSVVDAKTMLDDLGTNYQTQLNNKWTLDALVDGAATESEVNNVTW